MSIGFVMEVNHMGLRIFVGRVLDKIPNCREMREGFHAEFTVEATTQCVENLILFLCAMPD